MPIEEIAKFGASRLARIRVTSALNPIIWLAAAIAPIAWIAAWFFKDHLYLASVLIGIGCLPVLVGVAAYFVLLFKDPNRLQSEEFQLRQRALHMIYRLGGEKEIVEVVSQPMFQIEEDKPTEESQR